MTNVSYDEGQCVNVSAATAKLIEKQLPALPRVAQTIIFALLAEIEQRDRLIDRLEPRPETYPCAVCGEAITWAELCGECAKDNDPFPEGETARGELTR